MPTRTNGFVGIAEGNAPTNGTIENANLGASQQIVGRNRIAAGGRPLLPSLDALKALIEAVK
jgi:hypothetical protein